MDERDIARLYVAEMRALLPVLQGHLSALGASLPPAQRSVAASELNRLAVAAADLSADFHAEDCAVVAATLARAFPLLGDTPVGPALLASAADAITYLHTRVNHMDGARRILAPSESERTTVPRLLTALAGASGQSVSGIMPALEPALDASAEVSPQWSEWSEWSERSGSSGTTTGSSTPPPAGEPSADISERPLPPPVTNWLPPLDEIAPSRAFPPAPSAVATGEEEPARSGPDTALTRPALPVTGPLVGSVAGEPAGWVAGGEQPPAAPPAQGHPRVALSEEDLAILHAFRTGPLRHSTRATHPLQGETHPLQGSTRPLVPEAAPPQPSPPAETREADAERAERDAILPEWHRVFVFETTQDVQDLQRLVVAFEQQPNDGTLLQTMTRVTHKMKGNASTLGFDVFRDLAHAYEDQLGAMGRQGVAGDAATINLMLQGLTELDRALLAIAAGEQEDPDALRRMHDITATLLARPVEKPASDVAPTLTRPHSPDPSATTESVPPPPPLMAQAPAALSATPDLGGPPTVPAPAVRSRISAPLQPSPGSRGDSLAGAGPGTDRDTGSSARYGKAAGADALLRVDVRRMDALLHRVSALAINRAEVARERATALETQAELERSIGRITGLSERFADLHVPTQPRSTAPAPSAAPPLASGLLRGEGRGEAAPRARADGERREKWDELEMEQYGEYDELTRALNEAVADAATSATALRSALQRLESLERTQEALGAAIQDAVMRMRLVPLGELVPRLQMAVRTLAHQQGKTVVFSVYGEMTEIDRDVSEALGGALNQLVRNALVHGIEPADERQILGKPAEGHIWLRASYTGNEVNIELGDDGQGINPDKIIASALVAGVIDQETARTLPREAAVNLIFEVGVSSKGEPTPDAGRGVGMIEVAEALRPLRGTIEAESAPGEGTVFHMRVPVSLSMVRALHMQVAGQSYGIPFASVVQSVPIASLASPGPGAGDPAAPAGEPRRMRVKLDDGEMEMPVYVLAELLGLPSAPSIPRNAAQQGLALVVELGRQRAAFLVDAIVAEGEMVVRALPPYLRRHAVRGAATTAGGELLLLLDLPELVARATRGGKLSRGTQHALPALRHVPAAIPRVLVVDDSLTMRRALESMLGRAGYSVRTARDGMEALEQLLGELPDLLLLDVEMPRLDGFELLSVLRAHAEFAAVRVVMLTTRAAEKHRRHAEELGVDAYLVKPCPEDELLALIRQLAAG